MEDPPIALIMLNLMVLTAMAYSFIQWTRLLIVHRSDLRSLPSVMVPAQKRERPFWHPGDALLMFGSTQVIAGVTVAILLLAGIVTRADDENTAKGTMTLIAATLAAGMVAALITLAWLRVRDRNAIDKLSLRLSDADGVLGLKASVMILPPVLVMSALASLLVKYDHPVLTSMSGLNDPLKFSLIFIGTAIITPFVEELMFRVLLQGGLERLLDPVVDPVTGWQPKSYAPIFITSIVFASMHIGQGAAPIPLFFLSLGLGYLYRQTGNITAPMVVHMVLNGTTITMEGFRVMTS
ncbi:CPBP family intramembrane glutamic endopeptidase [Rubripirellula reticaptiva]|uniref:CAAX amino terminal protease self-immunity n=1 Tax=Rubripirellula reticaptiva TaxID=2528013 RepID=A0A5C6EHD3_9BACT|nr:CPBP family intramembrane glutamic endopeptidase [Rubripirellula reticaptiva]TWU47855.1 CAAX amino terminal protease self- immunity [Rubripirellula reticaptiva]